MEAQSRWGYSGIVIFFSFLAITALKVLISRQCQKQKNTGECVLAEHKIFFGEKRRNVKKNQKSEKKQKVEK